MQFGEAFLSLVPQLDQRAVSATEREAQTAGQKVGKQYGDGFDKGTKAASDRASAFGSALAMIGAKATIGAAGVAAVAPAALQLTAAVLPATGAILGVIAAQAALKVASGVTKLAVLGVGDAITEGFTGTAEDAEKALSKLPPQAQEFARSMIALKSPIEDLRVATSDGLFAPVNKELDATVNKFLPLAQRNFPLISTAVGNTAAQFAVAARNGNLFEGVNLLLENTGKSIDIAGKAATPMANGIGAIVQVASRGMPQVAQGFANAATYAGNFLTEAEKTGQLDKFMQNGFVAVGKLADIFKNLASVVTSVLQAAGKSSGDFLGTIVSLTEKMALFFKSMEGNKALTDFFTVTGAISKALREGLVLILPEIGRALAILAPAVQPLIAGFLSLVAAVAPLLPVAAQLAAVVAKTLAGAMATLATALQPVIAKLVGGGSAGEGMDKLMSSAEKLGPALNEAVGSVESLTPALNLTAEAIAFVVEHTDTFVKLLPVIAAAVIVWKVAQLAANIAMAASVPLRIAEVVAMRQQTAAITALAVAQGVNTTSTVANTVATGASTTATIGQRIAATASAVAQRAVAAATAVWTGAQWLLNAALTANPIGIVVVAIAALVAAIVIAYKNHEGFRELVQKVWAAIKEAISATIDWFKNTAWPAIKTAVDAIGKGMEWLWKNAIQPAWEGIKKVIEVAWDAIKIIFDAGKSTVETYGKIYEWLWKNAVQPAWDGIKTVISVAWDAIKVILTAGKLFIEDVGKVFEWLWKNAVEPAWNGIKTVTQTWWAGMKVIFDAIKPVLEAVGKVFEWLWKNVVTPVWEGIKLVITAAWTAIKVIFDAIISFLQVTFQSAWNGFRLTVQTIWDAIKLIITTWWTGVQVIWNAVITFLSTTFKAAWDTFKTLVQTTWDAIKTLISVAWEAIKVIFTTIITFLATTFKAAWDAFKLMLQTTWDAIKTLISVAWEAIKVIFTTIITFLATTFTQAWNAFKTMLTELWNAIKLMISTTWNAIRDTIFVPIMNYLKDPFMVAWNNFKTLLTQLWEAIKTMLSAAWNWLKENVFNPLIGFLKDPLMVAWTNFKNDLTSVWDNVKNMLKAGWDFIKTNVFEPTVKFITETIPNAFDKGVAAVGKAWDKIQDVVKEPVEWVADNVIDGGIIKGFNWVADKVGADQIDPLNLNFATGGVLPGYTPGRDVHRFVGPAGSLELSGGEAIMRPEFTKAVGSSFVNAANAAARTGGPEGVKRFIAGMGVGLRGKKPPSKPNPNGWGTQWRFKEGGIIGAISSAWDMITNPIDAFKKFVSGQIDNVPFAGWLAKELLPKTIQKLIGGVTSWVGDKFDGQDQSTSAMGTGKGSGWQWQMNVLREAFPGLALHSGFRPGSITSSGNLSYHARGRAVDVPPRMDVFNWIKSNYGASTKELIYGPAGGGSVWNGRNHMYSSSVMADHYDHVHWAMKNGGLFKYDNGGWFKPGQVGINQLKRPEAVLTPAESTGLKNMGTDEIATLLKEIRDAIREVAPGVGSEINSLGSRLIVKNRTR